MAEDPIPADVREFVIRNIESIAYLEALLLLRSDAGKRWSPSTVAARLYIGEAEATSLLSRLAEQDLADGDAVGFQYKPDPAYEPMLTRLADLYSRQLIPVTNLIHSRPGRVRAFASAFKLRKDP